MKSLSIKIPIKIAVDLDDRGRLNPLFLSKFINTHKHSGFDDRPVKGLTVPYTFKIDTTSHDNIKQIALENGLPTNELICRLLQANYYRE